MCDICTSKGGGKLKPCLMFSCKASGFLATQLHDIRGRYPRQMILSCTETLISLNDCLLNGTIGRLEMPQCCVFVEGTKGDLNFVHCSRASCH